MRQYTPATARQFPTDRNPTTISVGPTARQNVAGAATVTLATYTVPAGRRALITGMDDFAIVTTVLAAGQFAQLLIRRVTSTTILAFAESAAAAALGTSLRTSHPGLYLVAGEGVEVLASLQAGAGTLDAAGGIGGVEFDA